MYVLFITLTADRVLMFCYARYVLTIKIQSRRAINAPKEGSMICTAHHGEFKKLSLPQNRYRGACHVQWLSRAIHLRSRDGNAISWDNLLLI